MQLALNFSFLARRAARPPGSAAVKWCVRRALQRVQLGGARDHQSAGRSSIDANEARKDSNVVAQETTMASNLNAMPIGEDEPLLQPKRKSMKSIVVTSLAVSLVLGACAAAAWRAAGLDSRARIAGQRGRRDGRCMAGAQ